MGNLGITELVLILVAVVVAAALLTVLPFWFIFRKAGFHPALSLLMVIPFVDIVLKFYLAFADWPAQKRADEVNRA